MGKSGGGLGGSRGGEPEGPWGELTTIGLEREDDWSCDTWAGGGEMGWKGDSSKLVILKISSTTWCAKECNGHDRWNGEVSKSSTWSSLTSPSKWGLCGDVISMMGEGSLIDSSKWAGWASWKSLYNS